jgi:hypothetical protein
MKHQVYRRKGLTSKFNVKYQGPYVIVKKFSRLTYGLRDPSRSNGKIEIVHISRLKPYDPHSISDTDLGNICDENESVDQDNDLQEVAASRGLGNRGPSDSVSQIPLDESQDDQTDPINLDQDDSDVPSSLEQSPRRNKSQETVQEEGIVELDNENNAQDIGRSRMDDCHDNIEGRDELVEDRNFENSQDNISMQVNLDNENRDENEIEIDDLGSDDSSATIIYMPEDNLDDDVDKSQDEIEGSISSLFQEDENNSNNNQTNQASIPEITNDISEQPIVETQEVRKTRFGRVVKPPGKYWENKK